MPVLALLCPGQGAQIPGFAAPWLELPAYAERLASLGEAAGLDLLAHGTTSDAATIRDTAVAQPLIVGASLASWSALAPPPAASGPAAGAAGAVAGHSVGELAAAALAGVLTAEQAMALVAVRGRAMAGAAALAATGMSAVVGGEPADVEAAIERSGASAANRNGAGQVVAAGTTEQLAALAADAPARARVVPLAVAGAFHTHHMAPASEALATAAAALSPTGAALPLLSNADGAVVTDGPGVLARLVAQVSRPVRWDLCQDALVGMGVTAVLELSPAGALAGLAKRSMPGVEVLALKTPADLDAAADLLARHGADAGAGAA